jgi:hypothetical protein
VLPGTLPGLYSGYWLALRWDGEVGVLRCGGMRLLTALRFGVKWIGGKDEGSSLHCMGLGIG